MTETGKKYKYLASNTLLFAISGFLSKFISFLMVPLYTGVLTTEEYGVADFLSTTVTMLLPFLTLSIIEATIRFCISGERNSKKIFSSTIFVCAFSCFICAAIKPIASRCSEILGEYYWYFWLIFATTVLEQLLFKFAKGIEKVKVCAFNSVVIILSTVLLNLIMLLFLKMGLRGYLLSMILANLVSAGYLFVGVKAWQLFSLKSIDKSLLKQMLRYSVPFIPTASAWWINTAADRYIVIGICGVAANGLYSMGNKLPSMMTLVTSVFQQAWQISGIKEYNKEGYSQFYSKIYCSYVSLIGIVCSFLIFLSPLVGKILFKNEFYEAWKFSPYLLIGTLFSSVSGILAALFNAAKKNGLLSISTIFGAVINVGMNLVLVKYCGPIGAAIATAVSFFGVWFVRYFVAQKLCKFQGMFAKVIAVFLLLMAQATIMSFDINNMYLWSALLFVLILCICSVGLTWVFLSVKNLFTGNRGK